MNRIMSIASDGISWSRLQPQTCVSDMKKNKSITRVGQRKIFFLFVGVEETSRAINILHIKRKEDRATDRIS